MNNISFPCFVQVLFCPLPVVHISATNTAPPETTKDKKGKPGKGKPAKPAPARKVTKRGRDTDTDVELDADKSAQLHSYACPLYKKPHRTDLTFITTLQLNTPTESPAHWTLRGVALLCDTK